jgi:hypothetical protein
VLQSLLSLLASVANLVGSLAHGLISGGHESVDVAGVQTLGLNGAQDVDKDLSGVQLASAERKHSGGVLDHHGDNGSARLDRQVETALLEGHDADVLGVGSGSLGEHEDALALASVAALDGLDGAAEGLHGLGSVLSVQEDGAGQRHELAQQRVPLEGLFGGDGAVLGEDATEHQNVHFVLVVGNQNAWSGQVFGDVVNGLGGVGDLDLGGIQTGGSGHLPASQLDADTQEDAHRVVEGSGNGPLGQALLADGGENGGRQHAVGGTGGKDDHGDGGADVEDELGCNGHSGNENGSNCNHSDIYPTVHVWFSDSHTP